MVPLATSLMTISLVCGLTVLTVRAGLPTGDFFSSAALTIIATLPNNTKLTAAAISMVCFKVPGFCTRVFERSVERSFERSVVSMGDFIFILFGLFACLF